MLIDILWEKTEASIFFSFSLFFFKKFLTKFKTLAQAVFYCRKTLEIMSLNIQKNDKKTVAHFCTFGLLKNLVDLENNELLEIEEQSIRKLMEEIKPRVMEN